MRRFVLVVLGFMTVLLCLFEIMNSLARVPCWSMHDFYQAMFVVAIVAAVVNVVWVVVAFQGGSRPCGKFAGGLLVVTVLFCSYDGFRLLGLHGVDVMMMAVPDFHMVCKMAETALAEVLAESPFQLCTIEMHTDARGKGKYLFRARDLDGHVWEGCGASINQRVVRWTIIRGGELCSSGPTNSIETAYARRMSQGMQDKDCRHIKVNWDPEIRDWNASFK